MEKPILFSTEMVKAILAGKKTMTRRVVKSIGNEMHYKQLLGDWVLSEPPEIKDGVLHWELQTDVDDSRMFKTKCPYGQVGDILWVRETFCYDDFDNGGETIYFKADYTEKEAKELFTDLELKWKPSIFMPRYAAKLFLKVTNIRVERLQDITEEDAMDEGVKDPYDYQHPDYYEQSHLRGVEINKCAFAGLWDSINAKRGYGWELNNWVWVVEFERADQCS